MMSPKSIHILRASVDNFITGGTSSLVFPTTNGIGRSNIASSLAPYFLIAAPDASVGVRHIRDPAFDAGAETKQRDSRPWLRSSGSDNITAATSGWAIKCSDTLRPGR